MYHILGCRRGSPYLEHLDQTPVQQEAEYMLREYALAFGPDWTVRILQPEDSPDAHAG